jgi:hypothetical protein
MAIDMGNTVCDWFVENFATYCNDGLTDESPMWVDEVTRGPLQDDPTFRAYYLAVSPDWPAPGKTDPWRMPVAAMSRNGLGVMQDIPEYEVGGRFLYVNFFRIEGWLSPLDTRELAYEIAGAATRRLERAFGQVAHNIIDGVGLTTTDGHETTSNLFPTVFNLDGVTWKLTGGDNTWFPRVYLKFHVFSHVTQDFQIRI